MGRGLQADIQRAIADMRPDLALELLDSRDEASRAQGLALATELLTEQRAKGAGARQPSQDWTDRLITLLSPAEMARRPARDGGACLFVRRDANGGGARRRERPHPRSRGG